MSFSSKLRIGEAIVDLALGELDRAGVRERLPDQAAEVLAALVEHPGELVTREALTARLWPRTTYSDTDAGLNTAVKKLRAALRDDADHPRYIETVPRRGYRLIASVELVADLSPAPGSPAAKGAANVVAKKRALRSRTLLLGGAVVVLGILAALFAYQVRDHVDTPNQRASTRSELPVHTVAVLPFLNLTGDARQDYLALGLAENVLHQLAQLRGINVIARTSSFAVDAQHLDVREVGGKLNARYVVEGSVQIAHAQIQVTTQLIDASTGEHLWSKRFDSTLEDAFDVQQQIAAAIAESLQPGLGSLPAEVAVRSGTQNADAWLACELGRSLVATRNYAKIVAGIDELERAVRLDPRFATAFVELSQAFVMQTQYAPAASADEIHASRDRAINAATTAANRALAIDATLGDALIARGVAHGYIDRLDQAERDMRAGLALSPNSARGHQVLGELLIERGTLQEGLALLERASLLDPLEPRGPYYRGFTELRRGRAAEAERLLLEALRRQPGYAPALTRLSALYWLLHGEFSSAVKFGELALKADPNTEFVRGHLADAYLELGDVAAADRLTSSGADPSATRATAVDLRNGAIARAAAKVRAFPERFVPCDYVSHSYAILEDAVRTRDFTGARQFLEKVVEIDLRDEPHVRAGSEFSATVVAQLLALGGDDARARALLTKVLAQTQDYGGSMLPRCGNANRTRARALALLGRNTEAVQHLSRAVLQENAWYYGWYLFERDSAFAGLRGSAGFESLHAAYRNRVTAEKAKLALLRDDGLIPVRP